MDLEEGKYSDTEDEHIRYEDEKKFPDDSDGFGQYIFTSCSYFKCSLFVM